MNTNNSRNRILSKLRRSQPPFADVPPVQHRRPMVPLADTSLPALRARFIEEARKVSAHVAECADDKAAVDYILEVIGEDKAVLRWDELPVQGLDEALKSRGITAADLRDASVRVGLTGVDAAIASTGSLMLCSGPGKPRSASLLPHTHCAVVRESQLIEGLEAWFAAQKAAGLDGFRASSNNILITGASRTADIAMELVMGAHGPAVLHIVLLPG